ncbi:MAG: KpsF/GutQ family sugar-phosphate isomerase [Alphaproteobacteria bacterium]|nr:KpsF/GutQ family sugar-phosphate isomerase [Alphaproteobacteria bacterium]
MNVDLEYARSVFKQEIEGLEGMYCALDNNFVTAVDLICKKSKGHVIVSGMGKPGHIGKKISATLSSVGTPSFFLHPAEASHGDLGEISNNDVLLVLSLSGNTSELIPMLSYANRFGIDVIGVTANADSILAKSSRVLILMPQVKEACPYNLAPTTTSTMMLVIGDALALCLLNRKQFSRDDFKSFHPGGTLGKRLLKVSDLMHSDIPLVQMATTVKDVLIEMTQKSFGCTCVVDENGKIIGIITDGDLRRKIDDDFLNKTAADIMTRNPKVISEDDFAQEALKIMNKNQITSLFICREEKPCGILHVHDCLRAGLA